MCHLIQLFTHGSRHKFQTYRIIFSRINQQVPKSTINYSKKTHHETIEVRLPNTTRLLRHSYEPHANHTAWGCFAPKLGAALHLADGKTDRRTRVIRLRGAVSFVNQIRLHFYAAAANLYCGRDSKSHGTELLIIIAGGARFRRLFSFFVLIYFFSVSVGCIFFRCRVPLCSGFFSLEIFRPRKIIIRKVKINQI